MNNELNFWKNILIFVIVILSVIVILFVVNGYIEKLKFGEYTYVLKKIDSTSTPIAGFNEYKISEDGKCVLTEKDTFCLDNFKIIKQKDVD